MSVIICTPAATTTLPSASVAGNVGPITSGALWEIWDRENSVVYATDITPNGCNLTISGGIGHVTLPAGVSQGGDPDGNGRFEFRFSASAVAAG